jgi:pyruvate/2-oxoglutarate dehydrogenase complex dihydrolipoamide dehydrogenase (E3) component
MAEHRYDLVIIGAGSGGLIAASFAAKLGARVALVEKSRIGGDCTWTGCVPSKALLKAAKVAHEVRTACHYGITSGPPKTDMAKVRDYVFAAIQQVYQLESPETLQQKGIEVLPGSARFINRRSIEVAGRVVHSKKFLITTGARAVLPSIAGLNEVPFVTYEKVFENDWLPEKLIIIGGGPIGSELAQAYRRLGSQVTIVADRLLPKEDQDVRELIGRVFEDEGIHLLKGRAKSVHNDRAGIVVSTDGSEVRGDLLLVASGRKPTVEGLGLHEAGVTYSEKGIPVDEHLRTTVKNIYAAGDVVGGQQFTHFAGWQAFQAVRNALLPASSSGFTDLVPRVTFTDPEVAQVGPTEEQARSKYGNNIKICYTKMSQVDRAVCENDQLGFIKVIARRNGTILGATIVAARAGETLSELIVAIKQNMKVSDLAGAIHAYPTYSTGVQQLAADMAIEELLSGTSGRIVRGLSKIVR